jgi:hypothetical protein
MVGVNSEMAEAARGATSYVRMNRGIRKDSPVF